MSVASDACTNEAHLIDWAICEECLARDSSPRCYKTTEWYCAGCVTTVLFAERKSSAYTTLERVPHEYLCRDCAERGSKRHGRIAKPRKLGSVDFHLIEVRVPLHGGRVRDPVRSSSKGLDRRSGTGTREAAARAKAAAHRLAHRLMASYGVRVCACGLLTSNQWRPMSHNLSGKFPGQGPSQPIV